jgi:hypothetical protein
MKPYPPIKRRRRFPKPQVTRRQLHALVGRAICDHLLLEPLAAHQEEQTAHAIIAEVIQLLHEQSYR